LNPSQVVYEKPEQLHVHLYDTAKNQYQLPSGLVFDRPSDDVNQEGMSTADESHFEFHYSQDQRPWAFWVVRKSDGAVIFDTRAENIPNYDYPLRSTETKRNTTAMPSHPLIFENQYLQLSSALPKDANVYGLGEYISGGYRRNPNATLQPFMTLDQGDPVDSNMYGYHPVYMEARQTGSELKSHAVYYQNTAPLDVILREGLIQYRAIGGTLDFRFFSGDDSSNSTTTSAASTNSSDSTADLVNTPSNVISQYVNFIGLPTMIPRWSLGFHLCRWGYSSINETKEIVEEMRKADIPLETQWNDIDYMWQFRDWTTQPDNFSSTDFQAFTSYLSDRNQHYIPIVDAAVAVYPPNGTDTYYPYSTGEDLGVFITNAANGTVMKGSVWPGTAAFPSWTNEQTQDWWTESLRNFTQSVNVSGLWLDMNEMSSFCIGSCGSVGKLPDYTVPTSVSGWPEGYDNYTQGDDGNLTSSSSSSNSRRRMAELVNEAWMAPSGDEVDEDDHYVIPQYSYKNVSQRYLVVPPYSIHNGINYSDSPTVNNLNQKTAPMDSMMGNTSLYDLHNVWGTLEEITSFNALKELRPNERPFLVSRSTYPGAGKYTHHWLGDNYSLWSYAYRSLQGMLQFSLFGIPMVGPDVGGFNQNTDEELLNRWSAMGAMINPFYRNHNTISALSQEPFRFKSVANVTRLTHYKRNELLPYYYSVMARASQRGTPAIQTLWYQFPETFADTGATDSQVLFGPSLLVTPVLEPNVSAVKGYFPAAGGKWRNVFSYEALDVPVNKNVSIDAPLSTINAHLRAGHMLLTHAEAKYTTKESADGPFGLLINLNNQSSAAGDFYLDDGVTPSPNPWSDLTVVAKNGTLSGSISGNYTVPQNLSSVVIMNVGSKPKNVTFADTQVQTFKYDSSRQLLNITSLNADLNQAWELKWE
jgi:alpha-glucosidase